MKKVFLLIVSLFFAVNALAQTKVKGVVVDSSNQSPSSVQVSSKSETPPMAR